VDSAPEHDEGPDAQSIRAFEEVVGSVAVLAAIPSIVHAIHEGCRTALLGCALARYCREGLANGGHGDHDAPEHGGESDDADHDAPDISEHDSDDQSAYPGEEQKSSVDEVAVAESSIA